MGKEDLEAILILVTFLVMLLGVAGIFVAVRFYFKIRREKSQKTADWNDDISHVMTPHEKKLLEKLEHYKHLVESFVPGYYVTFNTPKTNGKDLKFKIIKTGYLESEWGNAPYVMEVECPVCRERVPFSEALIHYVDVKKHPIPDEPNFPCCGQLPCHCYPGDKGQIETRGGIKTG